MVTDEPQLVKSGDPYTTCEVCAVKEWCGRRSGKKPLPKDYPFAECGGYVMLERAIELSRIPREYRNANLNTFVMDGDNAAHSEELIAIMNSPVELVGSGLNLAMLHHNKGTGKTFSACAVANEYIYKACMNPDLFDFENPLALYVNFGEWCNEIRRAHQVHDSALYDIMYNNIEKMKEVPLLVLDDIGSGRITDIIRDLTYDVVNKRKEGQRSTIYTSNFVDTTLRGEGYLGEVIMSRLLYNTSVLLLGGRDRRLS